MFTDTLGTRPCSWVNNAQLDITSTKVAEHPPCKPPKMFKCSSSTFIETKHDPFSALNTSACRQAEISVNSIKFKSLLYLAKEVLESFALLQITFN